MGYTHYWRTHDLDLDKWTPFVKQAAKLCEAQPIQFEEDNKDKPLFTDEEIRFNGIGNNGHETFLLCRKYSDFEFCKTARKSYDLAVTICLALLKLHFGDLVQVSSDGDAEDWEDTFRFLEENGIKTSYKEIIFEG